MDNISDHSLVLCDLKLEKPHKEIRFKTYRDYSHFDYNNFLNDLFTINWNAIHDYDDVDHMLEFLNFNLENIFNVHAPIKTSRLTKAPAPWLTDNLKLMIKLKRKALTRYKKTGTEASKNEYKQLRNFVTMAVRNEKKGYLNHKFRIDPKGFWQTLKYLNINSSLTSSSSNIGNANSFNTFFIDSVPRPVANRDSLIGDLYNNKTLPSVQNQFSFFEVTEEKVSRIISQIKTQARGIDNIDIKIISLITPHLTPIITFLINKCLMSSKFPSLWKMANVIPVPKNNNPISHSDFRPISILCCMSKILEKIVNEQLNQHFLHSKALPSTQSGFRKAHSTTTALLNVTDDLLRARDEGKNSCLILLDFSKAFDTLNHSILLTKLKFYGLSNSSLKFIESYLGGRSQRVLLPGEASQFVTTHRGVPQGSILGPLLFSIYTADFSNHLNNCKSHQYADDMQIYFSFFYNVNQPSVHINNDLATISKLTAAHELILNNNKTQMMVFGRDRDVLANTLNITLNGVAINPSSVCKNLGVFLDVDLRFEQHVSQILQKSFIKLKTLYIHKDILAQNIKLRLCDSLILSLLDYANVLYWPALTVASRSSLQKLQNSCIRFCYGLRKFDHITPSLLASGWFSLAERYRIHLGTLVYKINKFKEPVYLYDKLVRGRDIHNRVTRYNELFQIPRHSTAAFQRSFTYNAIKTYNNLPPIIKSCSSVNSFKNHLKKCVINERG